MAGHLLPFATHGQLAGSVVFGAAAGVGAALGEGLWADPARRYVLVGVLILFLFFILSQGGKR